MKYNHYPYLLVFIYFSICHMDMRNEQDAQSTWESIHFRQKRRQLLSIESGTNYLWDFEESCLEEEQCRDNEFSV